ncbi:MAG: GntR family transcriptional regulator [Pseudooceanicola sp.]|nr:GntR family transcriptional regulator [Pseudooceanicola sp.]
MDFFLNRHSGVPIRRQIRGMIEYAISFGDLGIGAALPSVRDLADQLGVAPMTVSQVYADLKRDGLVETRTGAGTFVADSDRAQVAARSDIAQLHGEIDRLIDSATAQGIGLTEFGLLFNARLGYRADLGQPAVIAVAGLFDEATRSYADAIARQVGSGVSVYPVTVERLQADEVLRARIAAADTIVTFLTLRDTVKGLFPNGNVVPIRFIPSEPTRLALASLDPMARVAVISRFPAFLPILSFGVQRFAAHCQDIVTGSEGDPGLETLLADRDVLIFATGAEATAARMPQGTRTIEYRHIPDPGDIDRVMKSHVARAGAGLRYGKDDG